MCVFVMERWRGGKSRWRDGRFLDYRVCTTRSPERRSEERRRRREKALPSAVFAAKEKQETEERI